LLCRGGLKNVKTPANAEGVASQSPGLIAAFRNQPRDRIHANFNPDGVAPESNHYMIDITFAFLFEPQNVE
jgi:hypothetical protein